MNKEQKFYSALKDLFIGAKLEGQSGYVKFKKRSFFISPLHLIVYCVNFLPLS